MTRLKEVTLGADIEEFVAEVIAVNDEKENKAALAAARDTINYVYGDSISPQEACNLQELILSEKTSSNAYSTLHNEFVKRYKPKSNKIIPCVGIFPGTKEKPHQPKGWDEGYAVQEDNVMLEFNVPATSTSDTFFNTIKHAKLLVNDLCRTKKLKVLWHQSEHAFLKKDLTSVQARTFACDPDLDAYTGGIQRQSPPDFGNLRTCGGHLHVGGDFNCPDFVVVLFLEMTLANYFGPQFILDNKSKRQMWYGRPGVYRSKPYGIEYRTLSNAWVSNDMYIADIARLAKQLGNTLMYTPAPSIQKWFRSIDWATIRECLLTYKDGSNHKNWTTKWHQVQRQYSQVKLLSS